jgi:hypothetical protein
MTAPIVRILLRYGVGALAGWQVGDMLAGDRDVVDALAAGAALIGALVVEWWYRRAKATGGAT